MRRVTSVHVAAAALLTMVMGGLPAIQHQAAAATFVPNTVPHYYGPYANYANSALHMADAVIDFQNGGGSGAAAVATVDPTTGAITALNLTSGGSGYSAAPDVVITSPIAGGTNATAEATIGRGVTSIELTNAGHGYTAPPEITLDGDGQGATATANMSGYVDIIEIGLPGDGYVDPFVEIAPPDEANGVQATATVTQTGGSIATVTMVDKGSGYTTEPAVFIRDHQSAATSAAVRATVVMDAISSIDVTDTGTGYTSATVSIPAPTVQPGTQAVATATVTGAVTSVTVLTQGSGYVTPGGIKKFVNTLPGLGEANKNDLNQYIPIAVPDTTTYPGSDYYEIGVVQFREKMHSSIPATLLRGYVQLSTSVLETNGVSKKVALRNSLLDPTKSNPVLLNGVQVYGVDNPHQYGPFIMATKDRPVRVLFRNLLPTGVDGDLFIPVDTTVMGSGMGPTANGMADPDPQNPMCGVTPKPIMCYSENRAELHLHGGITPWISDGTPHQWITPAGESTVYPKGVSVQNVPDMPDPGPGAMTFFYTNQQSARLLFYHDHSYGITRLNVYAGESAGYLISDPTEKKLIANGTLPSTQIPLILSDKTFVPDDNQMAGEDPTWNKAKWGGEGSLWMPHVYMPIQNPGSSTGTSAFGRWAYGPWFWPPTTGITYGPKANPYYDPNCDSDVEAFCEPALIPGTPNVSMGMEAFNDTPLVNGTAYPTTTLQPKAYRFRLLNAADDRYWNLQLYQADASGTEVALNEAEVAAALEDPNVAPTPDTTKSKPGPSWIQIGTEGGFLPAPVVVPPQPVTYVTDAARFDVGNVDKHSLLIGPAERMDVIVDFSKYAGKTLILYNDAPAAFPARDARYDYYTGNGDLTSTGGAPSTLPGYGPNTRTVMQIKIAAAAPALPFNYSRLVAAFGHQADGSGVFESSQHPIIVGQGAYNSAYGTSFRTTAPYDGFARMTDGSLTFKTLANGASGAPLTIPFQFKAMHDEQGAAFDPVYGRMSGELGLEDPNALTGAQNVFLYPFINPSTESFNGIELPPGVSVTPISSSADGTQIWKITHNGVDTHAMHWHLYDVQLLNRVGWDGIIRPPEAGELGWKDTVRVSPLEDTMIAMRPIIPKLPFGVPDSVRLLDPTMPPGSTAGFNNAAPGNANPVITNIRVNFGWEYVWHCHLLSHEEMDMMRPVDVTVQTSTPTTPVLTQVGSTVQFNWTDGTPVGITPASWGSLQNEIGYRFERATVTNGTVGTFSVLKTALANSTTYTDPTAVLGNVYQYRVVAFNTAGESTSNTVQVAYGVVVLTGKVSAAGTGLNGAVVTAYRNGVSIASTTTSGAGASAGTYTLNLSTGSYKLYVQPNKAGYNPQWVGGGGNQQANATTLNLTPPSATQNITLLGSLSGVLTLSGGASSGQKLVGATVSVYNAIGGTAVAGGSVTSTTGGNYTVTLPPGSYKLYITTNKAGYVNQWVGGANIGAATIITVTATSTLNVNVHV